jgi:hypothetical protein
MVGKQVAGILTDHFGHDIKYDPCTPVEFGDLLANAAGDDIAARAELFLGIAFFTNTTTAPKPARSQSRWTIPANVLELEGV